MAGDEPSQGLSFFSWEIVFEEHIDATSPDQTPGSGRGAGGAGGLETGEPFFLEPGLKGRG